MSKIDEKLNSKLYRAMLKSKQGKNLNHYKTNSGRFDFPRFTKIQNYHLESIYVLSDLNNPSAFRLYLYLLRNITGYKNKEQIDYNPKKIKKDLNMGNSFYRAIECLWDRNLINYYKDKYDNKYIRLNVYPDTWDIIDKDKEIIDEIIKKEINELLGKKEDEYESVSSSSESSSSFSYSSSSSHRLSEKEKALLDEELLLNELDKM